MKTSMTLRAAVSAGALVGTTVFATGTVTSGADPTVTPAPACATSPTLPGGVAGGVPMTIVNPDCGFASLDGSKVWAGTIVDSSAGGYTITGDYGPGGRSAYRVEVPADWNGSLVMFAHGYAGTDADNPYLIVGNPQLRQYFVDNGYAWAASSYAMNGYDVGTGVVDTHDLLEAFSSITGKQPSQVIMSGLSMGGAITVSSIETYQHTFAGAMPYCGVLGGNSLFNFFLGANVTAAAVTHTQIQYPMTAADGAAYVTPYDQLVTQQEVPALGVGSPTGLTEQGLQWQNAVENLSGGPRPNFPNSLAFWNSFGFKPLGNAPFLFGLYPGLTGGGIGFLDGNVTDNQHTFYRYSTAPGHSDPVSRALNSQTLRVGRTVPVNYDPTQTELPDVKGTPGVPVVSVHGLGDLFVPFSMEQDYARLADANGQGNLFVSRAIREAEHCNYSDAELSSAFAALTNWISTGQKAAGDQILNPKAVASPDFGCRFTVGTIDPYVSWPSCPTSPAGSGRGKAA